MSKVVKPPKPPLVTCSCVTCFGLRTGAINGPKYQRKGGKPEGMA
jgi:hypothetical protein